MNDVSRMNRHRGGGHGPHDPDGFDPQLLQLFDTASQQTPLDAPESFVAATLLQMKLAARARLIRRCALLAAVMVLAAVAAPFIAGATLEIVSWTVQHLSVTGMTLLSSFAGVCAALLTWSATRRT